MAENSDVPALAAEALAETRENVEVATPVAATEAASSETTAVKRKPEEEEDDGAAKKDAKSASSEGKEAVAGEEESSSATQSKNNKVFVTNLRRPYTAHQLKAFLEEVGPIVEGSMMQDKFRSQCYVEYQSEDAAARAVAELSNRQFPDIKCGTILAVAFVQENPLVASAAAPPTAAPAAAAAAKGQQARQEKKVAKAEAPAPPAAEPAKLLDDLFRKTKATPPIYWLPLSDEEIKEKKAKLVAKEKEKEELMRQRWAQRDGGRSERNGSDGGRVTGDSGKGAEDSQARRQEEEKKEEEGRSN